VSSQASRMMFIPPGFTWSAEPFLLRMNSQGLGDDAGWPSAYHRGMRYAQRGGCTPAGQERRELLRPQAAERFARGDGIREIARDPRVTGVPVRRWHRAGRDGGTGALRSRGPVPRERPSPRQRARLEAGLKRGPLAHGFAGGRVKTLAGKLFHADYTACRR